MIQRCHLTTSASYPKYGAKGITVCDRWRESFENFIADMGEPPTKKHTIDRRDNSLGYNPDNCRWATMKEQQNNRTNNRLLTLNGETLNITQWTERLGFKRGILAARLQRGWSVEDALTKPAREGNYV